MKLTEEVARSAVFTKVVLVSIQCVCQTDKKLCSTLQAGHLVSWAGLEAHGELVDRQVPQSDLVDLELVVAVAGEQTLRYDTALATA